MEVTLHKSGALIFWPFLPLTWSKFHKRWQKPKQMPLVAQRHVSSPCNQPINCGCHCTWSCLDFVAMTRSFALSGFKSVNHLEPAANRGPGCQIGAPDVDLKAAPPFLGLALCDWPPLFQHSRICDQDVQFPTSILQESTLT